MEFQLFQPIFLRRDEALPDRQGEFAGIDKSLQIRLVSAGVVVEGNDAQLLRRGFYRFILRREVNIEK